MEAECPPFPPPPPMTAEQREQAETAIRAAVAREMERRAALSRSSGAEGGRGLENVELCAKVAPEICSEALSQTSRFVTRHKRCASHGFALTPLPVGEMPANKPRRPNLQSANLSFAARVIIWVRDRYENNAPAIYKAAYLSRKTYSAIISDENHVVSKRTAVQLAFALRLTREEADLLLHAAGYHLSRSVVEDIIFDACLEARIYNLEDVNKLLTAHECRPFVPQT